ncbi:Endonuclease/exonuclease/phosphatase, partial [Blakeslea trispora]
MQPKQILCKLASLNANGLVKTTNNSTPSSYLRFLRLQDFSILCFQETHASTPATIDNLNIRLQPTHSFWTPHVGIVSFSLDFYIDIVDTSAYFISPRFQLCKISHPLKFYDPFYILNIYAPVSPSSERREFYSKLAEMLQHLRTTIPFDNLVILGDFNYSHLRPSTLDRETSLEWRTLLDTNFFNCMCLNKLQDVPTFQRTRGPNSTVHSVIDYIYAGTTLHQSQIASPITHLAPSWSDHTILSATIQMGISKISGGLWRANPAYTRHKAFRDKVQRTITKIVCHPPEGVSPQLLWEQVKEATGNLAKKYGIKHTCWRTETLKKLEKRKNRILRSKPPPAIRATVLPPLMKQIQQLQQELTDIAALKANIRWRERGEKSASFLKLVHQRRSVAQYMAG